MSDKRYCANGKIVEMKWGQQLKLYIYQKDVDLMAGEIEQNGGLCVVDIVKRKQPSDKGMTHYAVINSWRPDKKKDEPQSEPGQFEKQQPVDNQDSLPF